MGPVPERTAGGYSPTVKKRSLGRMLPHLRKEAGLAFWGVLGFPDRGPTVGKPQDTPKRRPRRDHPTLRRQ